MAIIKSTARARARPCVGAEKSERATRGSEILTPPKRPPPDAGGFTFSFFAIVYLRAPYRDGRNCGIFVTRLVTYSFARPPVRPFVRPFVRLSAINVKLALASGN